MKSPSFGTTLTPNDTTRYSVATGVSNVTVVKANAIIVVNGFEGIYDGTPKGAPGPTIVNIFCKLY